MAGLITGADAPPLPPMDPVEVTQADLWATGLSPDRYPTEFVRADLDAAGVDYVVESEKSIYFRDPDGARLELLADPLGEMYGTRVL